ncbi:TolC family protein [Baaleninema simplex]|uniref:TolC family protein n=1 Tax=Baaleninema simplex TaxID=2862350 RepID=UPI0005538A2A|nr:TolC family protein [Baaleninema simplex]
MTRLRYWMAVSIIAALSLHASRAIASMKTPAKPAQIKSEEIAEDSSVTAQVPPEKKRPRQTLDGTGAPSGNAPSSERSEPEPSATPAPKPEDSMGIPNPPDSDITDVELPEIPSIPQPSGVTTIPEGEPPPPYLDPHPNLLRFPTEDEEVELLGIQPITLDQAIELAVRNNLDLQESRLALEASRANLREVKGTLFPQLDLSSNVTWNDSASSRISIERQEEIQGVLSPLQTDSTSVTWDNQLQLSYDVYTFGRRAGQIGAARGQVRVNELELERQLEDIRLDVSEAYYNVQQSDMDVRIARSAVENSQQSLEDAQALEEAGVGTQFDVLRAEVQLANDQQQLTQALSDQQVARRTLAQVLNVPQSVNVAAADPVDLEGIWEMTLEESIVRALHNRAELEQQLVQREISDDRRRVALAQTLPQFSIFGSMQLLDVSEDDVGGLTDGYAVGAQMQWRLFNGGASYAAARQEELNRETAEVRFSNLRNQIRLQVERAYYELEARLQNVQTSNTALTLAEESLDLARLRFRAGVGTQTDVIQAQDDLTQAQGNLIDAIIGYNRALAQIRRAVSNYPFSDEIDALLPSE